MIAGAALVVAIPAGLYLLALAVNTVRESKFIGADVPPQTTISVSGEGEVYGTPDVAIVSFAISEDAKTPGEASSVVNTKMNDLHSFLKSSGVAEKDIKTTGYTLAPKYEWQQSRQVICTEFGCPPNPGKQVLVGYTVRNSVEVKLRILGDKPVDVGAVVGGLAEKGATDMYGPEFKVDQDDAKTAEARNLAIADAQAKAKVLADKLGVSLVRVVSFNEGGSYPIYNYARGAAPVAMDMAKEESAAIITPGENRFVSNVTIIYEIR
jgi:hypothetical protein